ncbi:Uncharacterised protein [Legionella quinlivanii]|nr:Uncharacterised protein [Legionella quinlivanii]
MNHNEQLVILNKAPGWDIWPDLIAPKDNSPSHYSAV